MRRAFFYLVSLLPFPILYVVSDLLVLIGGKIAGYRKSVIIENLKNAFPQKNELEIKKLIPAVYRNLTDVMLETFKLLTISKEDLIKRIHFKDIEVINKFYYMGETVIAATSHSGNWEWILAACSIQLPAPADGVYQEIKSSFFENLMYTIRSRFGSLPVEKNNVFRESLKKRNTPHIIALVADQSPPLHDENIHWVKFFNQDTAFYNGMERLAESFGWPVIFVSMKRLNRGHYEIGFIELESKPKNAKKGNIINKYAQMTEKFIKENPSDWLWSHNRWKRKKDKEF